MKLRTYYALCCLCALRALGAASEDSEISSEWRNSPVSNVSESLDSRESSARDKRALGLILSGLAQVFGYTVSPVQIATLSNGNTTSSDGGSTQQSASPEQTPLSSNSTQSTATSATVPPRQRETIRFTGVVNFGNTSVLGHLQQYEDIFHGGRNASAPATTATPPTSTPLSVSPFLVNIPLPPMRQPPLPEIPAQDIRLSYPEPLIPIRREQQMMYGKNESAEKLIPESRELQGGKVAQSPPPPTPYTPFYSPYTVEPRWRKEYEDRLADLERKHEEHAERLRQQERYRNRVKDDSRGSNEGEMKMARGDDESKCDENKHSNVDHLVENDSRERSRYSSSVKEPQGSEEKLRDYDNDDDYNSYKQYDDSPSTNDTYTSLHYNEPLPINEDDEERRPEELRNSYGEPLNSPELVDEGFGNYFGKLKHTQSDFYASPEKSDSREDSKEEGEDSFMRDNGDEDESDGKEKKEYDLPVTNKYEEYSLEEDTGTKGKNVENSEEEGSEPFVKYSNEVPFSNENGPNFEGRKSSEEVDFTKYMPLIVPFRYLAASEESKRARSRLSTIEKSDKVNNVADREGTKKLSSKESSRPRKENSKPKIGIPERPKKLHEGEQKELQMWPPPFDFVLDSTIQTGDAQKPRYTNGNPLAHQNPELHGKEEGKAPQRSGKRISLIDSPTPRQRDYPQDINYRRFKGGLDSRAASSTKAKSPRVAKPGVSNRTGSEDTKSHLQQRKRLPNVHSHRNVKGSNVEIPRSMHSKRLESLKRSAEKTGPIVRSYYSGGYLGGDQEKTDAQSQNGEDFRLVSQELVPLMGFDSSRDVHDFLNFDKKDYRRNYGGNEMAGLRSFQGDETMQNGEKTVDLAMSQQNPYRYDERLAKYASEPESKNEKVGDFANSATAVRIAGQKKIDSSRSIGYVELAHVLQ